MKVSHYRFELAIFVGLIIYGTFHLSPSSYGIALDMFGIENDGLLFGSPRGIRSDEWSVWTPYFQALVNNDFARFDTHSLYPIDFRNFYALPIHDWGMIFKPLLWPFLVFEPATAFSLHHGLTIAAFLVGWKQFFSMVLPVSRNRNTLTLVIFSLMLYYTSFSQMWWTTLGPLLAMTPWLLITLFSWKKHTISYYLMVFFVSVSWLLSHTYPPIIVSAAYFGVLAFVLFQPAFFKEPKRIILTGISCLAAVALTYLYFSDIIKVMMETVYPGQRVAMSGTTPVLMWLSAFIPYLPHSNNSDLLNLNICEVAAVSSLLPLLTTCFLDYRNKEGLSRRNLLAYGVTIAFFSVWMLATSVPALIGKLSLLYLVPSSRLLWVLGLVVNVFALHILIVKGSKITGRRLAIYSVILITASQIPSMMGLIPYFKKSLWELLSIPMIIGALILGKQQLTFSKTNYLVTVALLVNMIYFFSFNPIQSSKPIFDVPTSPQVGLLKAQQELDDRGWLVKSGYFGAVLYGAGLNSFTNVLMQPQLNFFRELYPAMDENEFNQIFNRYAHIHIYDGAKPNVLQADVIQIPRADLTIPHIALHLEKSEFYGATVQGQIDLVREEADHIIVKGWGMVDANSSFFANLPQDSLTLTKNITRPDVAKALSDPALLYSGFSLTIKTSGDTTAILEEQGLCIATRSDTYGFHRVNDQPSMPAYQCKLGQAEGSYND